MSHHLIRSIVLVLVAIFSAASFGAEPQTAVFALNQRLGRGINVLGWDPIWQDFARGHVQAGHFKLIREAGFNHVRVNLHPLRDGKPDAQGRMDSQFFTTLDWAVDTALANHLIVILDYHDDLAISPDPEGKRQVFLATWKAIADFIAHNMDEQKWVEPIRHALIPPEKGQRLGLGDQSMKLLIRGNRC